MLNRWVDVDTCSSICSSLNRGEKRGKGEGVRAWGKADQHRSCRGVLPSLTRGTGHGQARVAGVQAEMVGVKAWMRGVQA